MDCMTAEYEAKTKGNHRRMAQMKSYEYSPLPTLSSIRVLHFEGKNEENGLLQYSLTVIDLDYQPLYHALSYTWGNPYASGKYFNQHFNAVSSDYSPLNTQLILVDGGVLNVQRNLYEALCQIPRDAWAKYKKRKAEKEGITVDSLSISDPENEPDDLIWIDAICIDQSNLEERASQVAMMDQIFGLATFTIIWLGTTDEYSEIGVQALRKIASTSRENFINNKIELWSIHSFDSYLRAGVPPISWYEWKALGALFQRQWFSRQWIIQETVLANTLLMYIGPYEILWDDLRRVAEIDEQMNGLMKETSSEKFLNPADFLASITYNIKELSHWREDHMLVRSGQPSKHGRNFSILEMLYATWRFLATDPRDNIYGMYGILRQYQNSSAQIYPNYSISVVECFANITKKAIDQSKDLQILHSIQDKSYRETPGLPTWVPDYAVPGVNIMVARFSACGETKMTPVESTTPLSLRVKAMKFDKIIQVGKERPKSKVGLNNMFVLDQSWFELTLLLNTPYFTGEGRTEVLWRTLCANQYCNTTSSAPSTFRELFRNLVTAMVYRLSMAESLHPNTGKGGIAPCLGAALGVVRKLWDDPDWKKLRPGDIVVTFNTLQRNMSDSTQQTLMYALHKIHCLSKSEPDACTPTLDEIERFESEGIWKEWEEEKTHSLLIPGDVSFVSSMLTKYGRRRLFVTEKGYMGLAHAEVDVGDTVWLIPGAYSPFVLRDASKTSTPETSTPANIPTFEVIGESYVHGIMHGEAAKEWEELQIIELV